jgi:hypothetical protein
VTFESQSPLLRRQTSSLLRVTLDSARVPFGFLNLAHDLVACRSSAGCNRYFEGRTKHSLKTTLRCTTSLSARRSVMANKSPATKVSSKVVEERTEEKVHGDSDVVAH